jgi:hypothetical protein
LLEQEIFAGNLIWEEENKGDDQDPWDHRLSMGGGGWDI